MNVSKSEIKRRAEIMLAFADGATIQSRFWSGKWKTLVGPEWDWDSYDYRVMPKNYQDGRDYQTKDEFIAWVEKETAAGKCIQWSNWDSWYKEKNTWNEITEWVDDTHFTVNAGDKDRQWVLALGSLDQGRWISVDNPNPHYMKGRAYQTKDEFIAWVEKETAAGKCIKWSETTGSTGWTKIEEWYDDNTFRACGLLWCLFLNCTYAKYVAVDNPKPKTKKSVTKRHTLLTPEELESRYNSGRDESGQKAIELSIEKNMRARRLENWEELCDDTGRYFKTKTCALCHRYDCSKCPLGSCDVDSQWSRCNDALVAKDRLAFMRESTKMIQILCKLQK